MTKLCCAFSFFFTLHRLWCFPTNYMRLFLRRSSPLLTSLFAFTEEHCSVSPKFYERCAANSFIKVFMLLRVNILAWTSAFTVQHRCRHDALIFIYWHAKNIHCLTARGLLCLQLLMQSFWVKHFKHSFRYCRKSSLLAFRYCIKGSLLPPKSFLQAANGGSIIQVLFLWGKRPVLQNGHSHLLFAAVYIRFGSSWYTVAEQ